MQNNTKILSIAIIIIISMLLTGKGYSSTNFIYATDDDGYSLVSINQETSTSSSIGNMGEEAMGIAIDNNDGTIYTIVDSGIGLGPRPTEQLASIDPVTGTATRIGAPMWDWMEVNAGVPALEIANDGILYAGGIDGTFYSFDTTTGEPTLIRSDSIPMVMDYAFDSFGTLWAVAGTKNEFYTVDTATGNATFEFQATGVETNGFGIMGIMFDENDVMYATNMAQQEYTYLYSIDTNSGAASNMGALDASWTHGGDIYIPAAVAPEPLSSTLFVAGSAVLGYRRFRKRQS